MLQYVNAFACTVNEDSRTLVVHFIQNEPFFSEENGEVITVENEIASVVMEQECAKNFAETLANFYVSSKQDTEEQKDE